MIEKQIDFDCVCRALSAFDNPNGAKTPVKREVIGVLRDMLNVMFPTYFPPCEHCGASLEVIYDRLSEQISLAEAFVSDTALNASEEAERLVRLLPDVKKMLLKDAEALYEGDPAATSVAEVILSYPGFLAISIYRIAHELYIRKIPILPRIMTEYAHEKTGIDIHAGATIGEYFFIDHGTGIVIGETTTIGNHVKIYQGVTLGAKSFELDEDGNPVKGIKRHPDIGNCVIIYANATILGGSTKIGDGSIIGGNVWLTHSVEPGSTVYYEGYSKRK
ncbi:MAG: serine acetyltransferase [Ruminococcaceae bacterium]|nr:serine acetyltransferase [Oscillospiraceae bacterium]